MIHLHYISIVYFYTLEICGMFFSVVYQTENPRDYKTCSISEKLKISINMYESQWTFFA